MKKIIPLAMLAITAASCAPGLKCADGVISRRYIHKYGVELGAQDWKSRGGDGEVVVVMGDGTRVVKRFENGKLNGDTVYTYPYSDAIMKVETYNDGKLERIVSQTPTGAPEKEETFLRDGTKTVTLWYDNQTPKSVEDFRNGHVIRAEYYTRSGQMEGQVLDGSGVRVNRDRYGDLQSTDTIEDGHVALRTVYHSNGVPKAQTSYHNGKVEGERKLYLPTGEPEAVEQWSNNCRNGITLLFQNGEKVVEIPFVNDIKDGVERRYQNGNILVQEIHWKNGRRHGPTQYYIDNIVQTEWYFHGNQITRTAYEQMKKKELR